MCGIIGYIGNNNRNIGVLIDGLARLEYRGYDSSGIAYYNNKFNVIKAEGELKNLKDKINKDDKLSIGVGHTRWATHGISDEINAHPHIVGKFIIVHNGIIENYEELKKLLKKEGYKFKSTTDTEVACAMLDYIYKSKNNIIQTINEFESRVVGSYALVIICKDDFNKLYVVKNKSPLIIGVSDSEKFIASDVPAILDKTNKYIALNDGDIGEISADDIQLYHGGKKIDYKLSEFEFDLNDTSKNGYKHYMLKEMNEEPDVFTKTLANYDSLDKLLNNIPDLSKFKKIRIVACGSAMHAGLVGKQLLESIAQIKTEVNIASEFRYNNQFLEKDELVIAISQSGETADTLEAVTIAGANGNKTLGIVNVKGSRLSRVVDYVLYTEAGSEIAVATTKAYLAQVVILMLITMKIAYQKKLLREDEINKIYESAKGIPGYIKNLLADEKEYKKIARYLLNKDNVFFIGRNIDYASSMEGSLKLKEISYIHSEAYASGELKHGTISLIEDGMPVIALVTDDNIALKTISNIKEVKARGAYVIYVTNRDNDDKFYDIKIKIPKVIDLLNPILLVIPLQMIAYYTALLRKCNIDKPKNLAKSVTVE